MKQVLFFLIVTSLLFTCKSLNQSEKMPVPSSKTVLKTAEKVADWQIETFEDQGKYRALPSGERQPWQNREKHHELDWTNGALYAGMFELSKVSHDPKYINWLIRMGERNNWRLHKRMYHADDHTVGQTYLNLRRVNGRKEMLQPTKERFDSIMKSEKGKEYHWDWCDALFMAPPVWAKLARITKDSTYLEYMDKQYRMTYDELWDANEQLFFRDKSYFNQTEKNGNKIFWARGNGWVFGGLANIIPELPDDWQGKAFYVNLFKKMAETLIKIQRPDGTWSAGLLGDIKDYPNVETSGTSFFTFGLTWGVNNGLLDKAIYEPVLLKAYNALEKCVNEEGMLGYVQPIGAAPGESFKDYTEVYGIGAFLAASSELYKYLNKFYPIEKVTNHTTFMEDGGWCWYQDPRAVISNDKLVMGGISGQSGDVRLGVYDLKKEKIDSTLVLSKNFQKDDHDVPALYKRPDGSLLAVWAKHVNEKIHHYNISAPNNYLKWGRPKEFHHHYDSKVGVTYMNLFYLKNEGLLYNFFRDGLTFNPAFITSDNHGETWGNRTHFIVNDVTGFQRPYARYMQLDDNTIGVSYTDGHPRKYGNSLYYVEYRDNNFYKVDGTKIKSLDEGPLVTIEGEKLYQGSETKKKPVVNESVPNSAWTCAMQKDSDNNPHIGYTLYLNDSDHRFRISSWDGKKWNDREIAYAGKCLYKIESSYTGLMAFDPTDVTNIFISTDVNPSTGEDLGGTHEIYQANIGPNDDISTINWKPITSNSNYRNIRPIVVADNGYKVLLWLYGPWHTYTNYDSNVVGVILEKP
ncbi:glycoside hydrolase family 88 protein [Flavobacteriaceae bacterium GSB9]|nr:glycoside hydrolase family 88 protein [Flavobacteriaceae bacterium GSB9]